MEILKSHSHSKRPDNSLVEWNAGCRNTRFTVFQHPFVIQLEKWRTANMFIPMTSKNLRSRYKGVNHPVDRITFSVQSTISFRGGGEVHPWKYLHHFYKILFFFFKNWTSRKKILSTYSGTCYNHLERKIS